MVLFQGAFRRYAGPVSGVFRQAGRGHFPPSWELAKKKKNASTGKGGNVLRCFGISGKVAGGRFAEIFLLVPPASCGKVSTEGKERPEVAEEAGVWVNLVRFLVVLGKF